LGLELGCVGDARKPVYLDKMERLSNARQTLDHGTYTPKQVAQVGIAINQDGTRRSGFDLLAFPNVSFEDIVPLEAGLEDVDDEIRRQLERDALYANYIDRQQRDVDALKRDEGHVFPDDFEYESVVGLSNELKSKLSVARPASLAQAARVDGMTPAALALLLARLKRGTKAKRA